MASPLKRFPWQHCRALCYAPACFMLGSRGVRSAGSHISNSTSHAVMVFRSANYVCHVWVELRLVCMQVRLFMSGAETVLTDAANPEELFATADFETRCRLPQFYPPCNLRQPRPGRGSETGMQV